MKSSGAKEPFIFVLSPLTLLTAPRAKFPRVVTPDDEFTRSTGIVQRSPDKKKNQEEALQRVAANCSACNRMAFFLCIFNMSTTFDLDL
jgi:hypothetical protein